MNKKPSEMTDAEWQEWWDSKIKEAPASARQAQDGGRSRRTMKDIDKIIQQAMAIEAKEAQEAGVLGYMCRALAMATMPHSDTQGSEFTRRNGAFRMTMLAPSDIGLPYGSIPRLIVSWITTEAVRTKQRELVLGDSLSAYMEKLGMVPTGGRWGTITRLREQIRRLLSASVMAVYDAEDGWAHKSVQMFADSRLWWDPKSPEQAGLWQSTLTLGADFFAEVVERPIPVDMRALQALKRSPMALDIYVWLTYRFSYLKQPTVIPWPALQAQFGAGYPDTSRGLADFRRAYRKAMAKVLAIYPAKVEDRLDGLLMRPSRTHVSKVIRLDRGDKPGG